MSSSIVSPWRSSALAITALAMTVTTGAFVPAQAVVPAAGAAPLSCEEGALAEEGSTSMTALEGERADAALATVTEALADGTLTVAADDEDLELDAAKVYELAGGAEGTSVTLPLGDAYSVTSNVTVLLDGEGSIAGYTETQVTRSADDTFQITSFVDGALASEEVTDRAFVTNDEIRRLDAAAAAAPGDVTPLNTAACVASVLGVSGVTAYLIVGACTGACAVPGVGTAVCVACIGAYATVGGASVTAVAACFR